VTVYIKKKKVLCDMFLLNKISKELTIEEI